MANFSKSIIIKRVNLNSTKIQCEISFGSDLRTTSPLYMVYFADEPFLRPDSKNSISVDYNSVTDSSSILVINIEFETSSSFYIDWFLNKQDLNVEEGLSSTSNKYTSMCTHTNIFKYNCYLLIDNYNNKDVGDYSAVIKLKDNPNVSLKLNTVVIKPSKWLSFI
jgi:hypothetical protein